MKFCDKTLPPENDFKKCDKQRCCLNVYTAATANKQQKYSQQRDGCTVAVGGQTEKLHRAVI